MFMLKCVLLSAFFGLSTTCIVRPGFWKRVKNKTLLSDPIKMIGGESLESIKSVIFFSLLTFLVIFFLGMLLFGTGFFNLNLYDSYIFIISSLMFQSLYSYSSNAKIYRTIMLILMGIIIILFIQDQISKTAIDEVRKTDKQLELEYVENYNFPISIVPTLDSPLIRSSDGPYYTNGKIVFFISTIIENGTDGVVIMEGNKASFLPCNYYKDHLNINKEYPSLKISQVQNIVLDENNTPYRVYKLFKKSGILGTYELKVTALYNLLDGTLQFYEKGMKLPEFVEK